MELWRYYRILRRRKWLIIIGILVCTATTFVTVWRAKPIYKARTTIMERSGASNQGVAIYRDPAVMQADIDVRLSNLGTILTSQTVIERAANSLYNLGITVDPGEILRNTTVQPIRATEILAIEVRAKNPEEAVDAANIMVNEFIRFYSELVHGATSESKNFIETQLPKAKAELDKIQQQIKTFKQNNDITQFEIQSNLMLQRAMTIRSELSGAELTAAETANRLKILRQQLENQPEMKVAALNTAQNPLWQGLATELARIEAELAGMEVTRGPNHPAVQTLQKRRDETRAKLEKEKQSILSSTSEQVNPIYQNVLDRYISNTVENVASNARAKALRSMLNEQMANLSSLPAKEMELAKLELERRAAADTYTLLRTKLDEATIREQETRSGSSIKVIDPARASVVNQQKGFKVALAAILSPILMCALAFLLHYLDNAVRTPEEVENLLGLPVTAVVPLSRAHNLAMQKHSEPLAVSYQILADNIWRTAEQTGRNTFLLASAEPSNGRTITAANLAVTLARDGARVILVDTDLRRPRLHAVFGLNNKAGLTNILAGTASIEDVVIPTKVEGLLLLASGPQPDNPVRLLRSAKMQEFTTEVSELADIVVFDSPAGVAFADAAILATHIHNVVLVQAAGTVPRGAETEFKSRLEKADANLAFAVLNMANPEDSHGYFHYRRSYQPLRIRDRREVMDDIRAIPTGTGSSSEEDNS